MLADALLRWRGAAARAQPAPRREPPAGDVLQLQTRLTSREINPIAFQKAMIELVHDHATPREARRLAIANKIQRLQAALQNNEMTDSEFQRAVLKLIEDERREGRGREF